MNEVEELRYLILALQREGNRMLAAALRPLGLTPAQGEALGLIARHEPVTLSGLGALLVCESGTNPSRIVDRLTGTGLVRRDTDPDDRRQVRLTVTARGRQIAEQVTVAENALHERLTAMIAGHQVGPALELLRSMAGRLPAGQALERRKTLRADDPS